MVRPALRSRSLRRVKRKTPGKTHKVHYKPKKPSIARCAICKKPLHGVPRERSSKMRIARTKKKPTRPYGGNLCSSCMRTRFKEKLYKSETK